MAGSNLLSAFPENASLVVVDIGAAGGLHSRWRPFAPIVSAILFDPREEAATGALGRGCSRVYPSALGRERGTATLNILALPNMSSVLEPNRALMSGFRKKNRHTEIVASETLEIEPLDEIAERDGFRADVLKIDTQGSELDILAGADRLLTEAALVVEVELSFLQRYVGQPLAHEIIAYMLARGFDLIELSRLKRYRCANPLGIANVSLGKGQRPGRVAYGDAVFLRNEATVLDRAAQDGGVPLAKAIVALVAYGKPDMAARLLDIGGHTLPAAGRDALSAALRPFAGSKAGLRHAHALVEWIARKV